MPIRPYSSRQAPHSLSGPARVGEDPGWLRSRLAVAALAEQSRVVRPAAGTTPRPEPSIASLREAAALEVGPRLGAALARELALAELEEVVKQVGAAVARRGALDR